jgi:hypothetical protein
LVTLLTEALEDREGDSEVTVPINGQQTDTTTEKSTLDMGPDLMADR